MSPRVKKWFYGLGSTIIGGAATSLSTQAGLATLHTVMPSVILLDLKQLGATALAGGFWAMVAYLKQSPLPPANGDTQQFYKTDANPTELPTAQPAATIPAQSTTNETKV